jgi:hypothetical protein
VDRTILEKITYGESASIRDAKRAAGLASAGIYRKNRRKSTKRLSGTVARVYRPVSASG